MDRPDCASGINLHEAFADVSHFDAVDAPEEDQEDDGEPVLEAILVAESSVVSVEGILAGLRFGRDG